jgi:hypothetical protein
MLKKSILIWFSIIPLAILNGGLRDYVTTHLISETYSRPISGITLCGLIFIVSFIFIPKLGKGLKKTYIKVGILWVLLTIIFETFMGLGQGETFDKIINQYNITTGNLWLIVVIFVGIVPSIVAKMRRII